MEATSSADPAPPTSGTGDPTRSLDADIQTVWRIKLAGLVLLLFLPVLFYDLTSLFSPDSWLPFGLLSGTMLVGGILFILFWPRLRYRAWQFALWPEELYREHGVITHVRTVVPLRRIQHVDVSQDLLEREFALGRLVVHTAGSRSSDVVIPGLPLAEAERIRDEIKRFILEDPLLEDPV
ncbi:MAG: PH domain-containing protein [Salinibacter sp.]